MQIYSGLGIKVYISFKFTKTYRPEQNYNFLFGKKEKEVQHLDRVHKK